MSKNNLYNYFTTKPKICRITAAQPAPNQVTNTLIENNTSSSSTSSNQITNTATLIENITSSSSTSTSHQAESITETDTKLLITCLITLINIMFFN